MRRFLAAAVVAVTCTFTSVSGEGEDYSEAEAESASLSCGAINNVNIAYQFGDFNWLEYIVETRRDVNATGPCALLSVRVEGYVVGVGGSGGVATDMFTASLRRQIPVPNYGDWVVRSEHYRVWAWAWSYHNGARSSTVSVQPRRTDTDPATGEPLLAPEDPNNPNSNDPIIVDPGKDGYRLTSVAEGVLFDIDADGVPDRVAWTDPEGDDEFLAFDRNGNGRIDDGSELIGDATWVYPDARVTAPNGFQALRMMEGPSFGRGYLDFVIDRRDAVYHRLLLWRDANHNGMSEPGELRRAADAGLVSISTEYKLSRRRDPHGNELRQRARVSFASGDAYAYDVWLRRQ